MVTPALTWGILSTANIGRKAVVPAIQAAPGNEILAVASRDEARARQYARELAIPKSYGSYETLLDDPAITAIYNPLPNSLHLPWTLRALEAGKHVLCEKPLGLTAAECIQMAEAAEAAGLVLMEAFMYRFHKRSQHLFELVHAGNIGTLRLIQSRFAFTVSNPNNIRLDADLGGGAIMDVGCYCVNVARTLARKQPVEVQAYASWGTSGVDETLAGTLRFEDGLIAQIDCALNQPRYEAVAAFGTEGFITVNSAFLPGTNDTTLELTTREGGSQTLSYSDQNQYQAMIEHFANCVVTHHSPLYTPFEAAENMAVIEALLASAREGSKTVFLRDIAVTRS